MKEFGAIASSLLPFYVLRLLLVVLAIELGSIFTDNKIVSLVWCHFEGGLPVDLWSVMIWLVIMIFGIFQLHFWEFNFLFIFLKIDAWSVPRIDNVVVRLDSTAHARILYSISLSNAIPSFPWFTSKIKLDFFKRMDIVCWTSPFHSLQVFLVLPNLKLEWTGSDFVHR